MSRSCRKIESIGSASPIPLGPDASGDVVVVCDVAVVSIGGCPSIILSFNLSIY